MWSMVASAAVSGLIGVLIWVAVRRPIDSASRRYEHLEDEVKDLREQRVERLEQTMEKAASARKELHEKNNEVRQKFVHKKDCTEAMTLMREQIQNFNGSVLKLERVSAETEQTAAQLQETMSMVIGVKEDLARLVGRVESMNGKH